MPHKNYHTSTGGPNTPNATGLASTAPETNPAGEASALVGAPNFTPAAPPSRDVNTALDVPIKLLGHANFQLSPAGYFINHINPTDNIIQRDVPAPLFDKDDVNELASTEIWELLPKAPTYPNRPPQHLELYAANWARCIDFGGCTDPAKNPSMDYITDWAQVDSNDNIIGPGTWTYAHKWPAEATLDPTYVFFTADPALFYTQRAISHYEPDVDGKLQPVMVPDNDIVWKLNGKEVHRGWYMDLSALSRTVEVQGGQAVLIPKMLSVEAHNTVGMIRKELKYAVIDSDDGALVSSDGMSETENFSSTFEGQFIADEDKLSENFRSAVFFKDPRYGSRTCYIRFQFANWGEGKSKRRKFRNSTGTFRVDGQVISAESHAQHYDRWQNKDWDDKQHQDAMSSFPNIFNDQGKIKDKYKDNDGSLLHEIGVTDWTGSRDSALFCHEPDFGFSKLFKFEKKPGPFDLSYDVGFKVRMGGWFSKKKFRFWDKQMEYSDGQLHLDLPLQPIDFGIVKINYNHRDL